MIDKLLGLWNNKRWLFFVLIVPVGLAFVYKVIIDRNIAGGKQDIKDAELKDAKLQDQQKEAEVKANIAKEEADKIEERIENIEVNEDWYKG